MVKSERSFKVNYRYRDFYIYLSGVINWFVDCSIYCVYCSEVPLTNVFDFP